MLNFLAILYKQTFLYTALLLLLFSSCATVKNYPSNVPFVYQTDIQLEGKFSTDEKKGLISQLQDQLHDSISVRRVQKLVFWETLRKPPVYDSSNALKSVEFMRALLNSLGYFRDTIYYDTSLNIKGDQYRTSVHFTVKPGKQVTFDSIWYTMKDTIITDSSTFVLGNDTLQKITQEAKSKSVLKKGDPFAKSIISTELDRLVDVYRNNGYLRFSREEFLAVWDTVGLALLRPTLDPLEQIGQLQALQERRQNPTADVEIRLRSNEDTTHLIRYYVGNIKVFPDYSVDTAYYMPMEEWVNGYRVISYKDLFKNKVVAENIYLHKGQLYSQRAYLRTLNRFNSIGSWNLVSIDQVPRGLTDTVDFVIKLTPARKYLFNFNVEGSKNWGNILYEGNFLGSGVNFGLQNRNFARAANQASTNARYGIELSSTGDIIQSQQVTVGHTILFPRLIPALNFIPDRLKDNFKTIFAFNVGNIQRKDLYNLTSFNTSWGYEFNWKNKILGLRFPNIEYALLDTGQRLKNLIDTNQSYKYIFNGGLVSSGIINYSVSQSYKNVTNLARFNLEASGLISGLFHTKFIDSNLHRFLRLDAEFRQAHKIRRTEFAWRLFGGVGYELPSDRNRNNKWLPFFRQYYGGGANSMRAWALRKLGPGSTNRSTERDVAPDRFGDIQLEANAEYRFFITEIGGIGINSALFTDMGNVWFLRENPDFPDGNFRFKNLWRDLAIGVGTGLRIDFGFFLVRLDYAYKAKNPSPPNAANENKWFYNWRPLGGQLQLGVSYPF